MTVAAPRRFGPVLAAGLAIFDTAVVTVALPDLGEHLRADISDLQWAVVGYALVLASFGLLGGALGTKSGRRRALVTGLTIFAAATLLAGFSPTMAVLIGARFLQAIGAILLIPAGLELVPDALDRRQWIVAAGPVASGILVTVISWRAVFVAVAVVAAAALIPSAYLTPDTDRPDRTRLDVAGTMMLALGLFGLAFAMIAVPELGFGKFRVWLAAAAGLLGLIAFALVERRRGRPGVGISDSEGRPRIVAMIAPGLLGPLTLYTLFAYAALGGLVFFLLIQLQTVAGYSAWEAGVAVLPAALPMLLLSARSQALASRIGQRRQLLLGPLVCLGGLALLVRIGADAIYWSDVLPGTLVLGLGLAVFLPALTAAAREAYAVHMAAAHAGQALSVAALPMLAGLAGAAYANPAAFHHGYRVALVYCGVALTVAAFTALALRVRPTRRGAGRTRMGL